MKGHLGRPGRFPRSGWILPSTRQVFKSGRPFWLRPQGRQGARRPDRAAVQIDPEPGVGACALERGEADPSARAQISYGPSPRAGPPERTPTSPRFCREAT